MKNFKSKDFPQEIKFEILKSLPIRSEVDEANYINYLISSFDKLSNKIGDFDSSEGFAIIPFHLLFTLSLQYKILRIFKDDPQIYRMALTFKNRDKKTKNIFDPTSPFDFSLLGEAEMLNLFKLIGFENDKIGKIKSLINYRNKLAHASGGIEGNLYDKCEEYLRCLADVHKAFFKLNQKLSKELLEELREGEDVRQFFEMRLAENLINAFDFKEIAKVFLNSGILNEDQKGILSELCEEFS